MVYEPLVKYQADGSVRWQSAGVTPPTAKRWFTLRDDVAFSNGEPFNAQPRRPIFRRCWPTANATRLELANQITDVRALSATELQITLKSAYAPYCKSWPCPARSASSPPRSLSMAAPPGIKAPIGTGPWRLANSQLNQRDVLVRNERYWGRKPALQQITIKVILTPPAGRWRSKPEKSICSTAMKGCCRWTPSNAFAITPATWLVCPPGGDGNAGAKRQPGPTREQAVREALNYAVDKQTLVDSVLYGTQQVADTLFAPPSLRPAGSDAAPLRPDKSPRPAGTGRLAAAGGPARRQKPGNRWRLSWRLLAPTRWLNRWPKLFRPICGRSACRSPVGEEESSIYARQREGRFGMIFNRTGRALRSACLFKLDARPVACGLPPSAACQTRH